MVWVTPVGLTEMSVVAQLEVTPRGVCPSIIGPKFDPKLSKMLFFLVFFKEIVETAKNVFVDVLGAAILIAVQIFPLAMSSARSTRSTTMQASKHTIAPAFSLFQRMIFFPNRAIHSGFFYYLFLHHFLAFLLEEMN